MAVMWLSSSSTVMLASLYTASIRPGMPACRKVESPMVAMTGLVSPALDMPMALPMDEPIDTVVSRPRSGSRHASV